MDHRQAQETMAAERYLLGEMSELERFRFEEHYFDCPECAADVRVGVALLENGKAVAREEARPEPAIPARSEWSKAWRPAVLMPLAACLVLAILASYQAFILIPSLRRTADPAAAVLFVLAPSARGEGRVITVPPATAFVHLGVDVNVEPASPRLRCEVVSAAGATVFSTDCPAPPPATPLLVRLPAANLEPASYRLVLRDSRAPETVLGEYAFTVNRP